MTTTTIRIEDDLKARVAAVAQQTGKTAHAFILDAIAQTVEQAEQDEALRCIADERWARLLVSGTTIPWDEARAYLVARAAGQRPRRPAVRKPVR